MTQVTPPKWRAGLPLSVGFLALVLLVGGIGYWSVNTRIAGAVIASGLIEVESNRQVVQHLEGGTVGAISARDGDRVEAGDLLIRLDDTLLKSELAIIETQLIEVRARRARLEAERDEAETIEFGAELLDLAKGSETAAGQVEGQLNLFQARRQTMQRELEQVGERIAQTENQIKGTEAQLEALAIQEELITSELVDQESLFERGLVQIQRISQLRREAARLAGELGELNSTVAQLRGQIAQFEIEKLRLETARREEAIVTLRDLQFRELEMAEQRLNLMERLARLDVRAPVSGIVYGSVVNTVSAIIQPAEALMFVIPQDQPLVVSARVDAIHVDQIHVGQDASLRFTAFDQRLTPEIFGLVTDVSADVFQDEITGLNYYRVELLPKEGELDKLENQVLLPGMPVEAFLKTAERTPLSYLTKPMTDYFGRALREG